MKCGKSYRKIILFSIMGQKYALLFCVLLFISWPNGNFLGVPIFEYHSNIQIDTTDATKKAKLLNSLPIT